MATLEELGFEMERRVIVFKPTTTMPDNSLLTFNADPNTASSSASPTSGEFLIYNSPISTRYAQLDPSTGNIEQEWYKQGTPNTWKKMGADVDSSLGDLETRVSSLESSVGVLDSSVTDLYGKYNNIDSSLGDYVRKDGDIMSGDLTATGISITNDLSVGGNSNIAGNLSIGGNLTVDGSTTILDTVTVDVSTNYIKLNTGLPGTIAPPDWLQSGIVVERGSEDPYVFVFDETQDTFRIGISTYDEDSSSYIDASTQAVATREDSPVTNALTIWNETMSRFDTSTSLVFDDNGLYVDGSLRISQLSGSEGYYVTVDASGTLQTKQLPTFLLESSIGTSLTWDSSSLLQVNLSSIDASDISYTSSDPSLWEKEIGIDPSTVSIALDKIIEISTDKLRIGEIIYVNHSASGSQTGKDWDNAFLTLVDALDVAKYNDQIWVAEGTYYPTTVSTNRDVYFNLKSGVNIYGGFKGGEYTKDLRDNSNLNTILSGDIDSGDPSNYSYHVVYGYGIDNVSLDGIKLEKGNANGTLSNSFDTQNQGAIVFLKNHKSIKFINSEITEGSASNYGGIYTDKGVTELLDTKVHNNTSASWGGAGKIQGNLVIKDSSIYNNRSAKISGLALFNISGIIDNVDIYDNVNPSTGYDWSGGFGIYNFSSYDAKHKPLIVNHSKFKNNIGTFGSAISVNDDGTNFELYVNNNIFDDNENGVANGCVINGGIYQTYITNNTFYNNKNGNDVVLDNDAHTFKVSNNIIEGNPNSIKINTGDTSFVMVSYNIIEGNFNKVHGIITDSDNIKNVSVTLKDPSNGNYSPVSGSVTKDAGDNTLYDFIKTRVGNLINLELDYLDNLRINNNIIDMGAIEYGNYGSEPIYDTTLDANLEMPNTVGGIPAGTAVSDLKGDLLIKMWDDLLFPTINPTYVNPNNTFIDNVNTLQEVAAPLDITFTATLNKGEIDVNGTTQDFRSGDASVYTYTDPSSNTLLLDTITTSLTNVQTINGYIVKLGTQTFTNQIAYQEGPQPLDNKGNEVDSPLPAGTTGVKSDTIEGVYPLFGTTSSITAYTLQPLVSMLTGNNIEFNMVPETSGNKQAFSIAQAWTGSPTNRPITGIQTYNTASQSWEYTGGTGTTSLTYWDITSTTRTIQGQTVSYDNYVFNGVDRSDIKIRLVF
jgi:hypothetical protein